MVCVKSRDDLLALLGIAIRECVDLPCPAAVGQQNLAMLALQHEAGRREALSPNVDRKSLRHDDLAVSGWLIT